MSKVSVSIEVDRPVAEALAVLCREISAEDVRRLASKTDGNKEAMYMMLGLVRLAQTLTNQGFGLR